MNIRDEQSDSLGAEVERQFALRIAHYVRKHHSGCSSGLSDEQLQEKVKAGIQRAKSHGLVWQSSVACFIGLMFEFGPSFSEHAYISPYLRSEQPDLALGAAIDELSDEQWDQINRETPKDWNF